LRLPFRPPLDAGGLLDFLGARAITGVEHSTNAWYARTLRLPHGVATARLTPAPTHVEAALTLSDVRDLGSAVTRLRRLLDLDADPIAVDELLGTDPALAASVAKTPGLRLPGSVDGEETLLRALLGQQVSVAAARTTLTTLATVAGEALDRPDGELTRLFPSAAAIAASGPDLLAGPARRRETVHAVACALADGSLRVDVGRDADELRAELESFPGIGPWTAGYVLMRVLGAPDVLLHSDLALRRGATALGLPADAALQTHAAARWRPWRSYAGMHLWRAAAQPMIRRTA
jgi:AraC family transcriptional regulator of adaptative response / DNA-3-methyladenine glycosylase II